MPVLSRQSEILPQPVEVTRRDDPIYEQPLTGDVVGAWMSSNNTLVSAMEADEIAAEVGAEGKTLDEFLSYEGGYNPFDNPENEGFPPEIFVDSRSEKDDHMLRLHYDKRMRNHDVLSRAKWWQHLAGGVVSIGTDPVVLGTLAYGGPAVRGAGALRGAGMLAADAAAAEILTETVLHGTQPFRTAGESAANVGGSALFGGALGTVVGRMGYKEFNKLVDEIDEVDADILTDGMAGGGAAQVRGARVEVEPGEMSLSKGGERLAKMNKWLKIPEITLALSKSGPAARIGELLDNSIMHRMYSNYRAKSESVGVGLRRLDGNLAVAKGSLNESYIAIKKSGTKISRADYKAVVSDALRHGDKTSYFADDALNGLVSKTAKTIRSEVFDHLYERAVAAKLIDPEDAAVVGKETYLNRVYNVRRIKKESTRFKQTAVEHFRTEKGMDIPKANKAADELYRNITGTQHGFMPTAVGKSGRLKPVVFDIEDDLIRDFLINDVDMLMDQYVKTLGAHVELAEKFGRTDMQNQIDEIKTHWDTKAQNVESKTAERYMKNADEEIEMVKAVRDRHLGRYRLPEDPDSFGVMSLSALRALNVPLKLGSVVASSLTELARPIFHHGFKKYSKTLMGMAASPRVNKLAKADMQRMGVAVDIILGQSRLHSYASIGDLGHSRFYAAQHKFSNMMGWGVGITPWTYLMRRVSGQMTINGVLEAAERWPSMTAKQKRIFRQAGLDGTLAKQVRKEFAEHGLEEGGLKIGNSAAWADKAAARRFETIVLGEVDALILNPSAGGQSLYMSTPLQKTIFQFKSFPVESITKIMIPSMQGLAEGDSKAVQGLAMTMFMAGIGIGLREAGKGNDVRDMTWKQFSREMVDRAGVTGVFFDMNNTMEKISENRMGLAPLLGESVRYSTRSQFGAVLGPSYNLLEDAHKASKILMGKEVTRADISAARRTLPLQNLMFLRYLAFDAGEEALAAHLGLPPKRKRVTEMEGETIGETLDAIGL